MTRITITATALCSCGAEGGTATETRVYLDSVRAVGVADVRDRAHLASEALYTDDGLLLCAACRARTPAPCVDCRSTSYGELGADVLPDGRVRCAGCVEDPAPAGARGEDPVPTGAQATGARS